MGSTNQGDEFCADVGKFIGGDSVFALCLSNAPVQVLCLIR